MAPFMHGHGTEFSFICPSLLFFHPIFDRLFFVCKQIKLKKKASHFSCVIQCWNSQNHLMHAHSHTIFASRNVRSSILPPCRRNIITIFFNSPFCVSHLYLLRKDVETMLIFFFSGSSDSKTEQLYTHTKVIQ